MTSHNLEIIRQIVLWYENSFRIDCLQDCHLVVGTITARLSFLFTYRFG